VFDAKSVIQTAFGPMQPYGLQKPETGSAYTFIWNPQFCETSADFCDLCCTVQNMYHGSEECVTLRHSKSFVNKTQKSFQTAVNNSGLRNWVCIKSEIFYLL
jgi:hypothetical protein